MASIDKNRLRESCGRPDPKRGLALAGRLAENLRKLEKYRKASRVFLDPSPLLKQARINALADGKILIMPGFGLKDGFYRLDPFRVPFSKLNSVVTGRELSSFGKKMAARGEVSGLKIEVMIGESWAADEQGYGVGEGKGFFDLAGALLTELGALAEDCLEMVAIQDRGRLVGSLQVDPWDIAGSLIITPDEIITVKQPSIEKRRIFWDALTLDRIRRIAPLWKLFVEQGRDRQV